IALGLRRAGGERGAAPIVPAAGVGAPAELVDVVVGAAIEDVLSELRLEGVAGGPPGGEHRGAGDGVEVPAVVPAGAVAPELVHVAAVGLADRGVDDVPRRLA